MRCIAGADLTRESRLPVPTAEPPARATAHSVSRPDFLIDGPPGASLTLALAHGAGAPMDSPFMSAMAEGLAARGWRIVRFEFPYMAARRTDGRRRPPDPAPRLMATWGNVVTALGPERLVIGGKSMGGRMASLIAGTYAVRGLVCLGYPFFPPGKTATPGTTPPARTAHLARLATPTLIVQGTRDRFGTPDRLARLPLSPAVRIHWIADGDHDLVPRKASGRTRIETWAEAITVVDDFLRALAGGDGARSNSRG